MQPLRFWWLQLPLGSMHFTSAICGHFYLICTGGFLSLFCAHGCVCPHMRRSEGDCAGCAAAALERHEVLPPELPAVQAGGARDAKVCVAHDIFETQGLPAIHTSFLVEGQYSNSKSVSERIIFTVIPTRLVSSLSPPHFEL